MEAHLAMLILYFTPFLGFNFYIVLAPVIFLRTLDFLKYDNYIPFLCRNNAYFPTVLTNLVKNGLNVENH